MYYSIAEVATGQIRLTTASAAKCAAEWHPGTVYGRGHSEAESRREAEQVAKRVKQATGR